MTNASLATTLTQKTGTATNAVSLSTTVFNAGASSIARSANGMQIFSTANAWTSPPSPGARSSMETTPPFATNACLDMDCRSREIRAVSAKVLTKVVTSAPSTRTAVPTSAFHATSPCTSQREVAIGTNATSICTPQEPCPATTVDRALV